jgi:hypothetical protein
MLARNDDEDDFGTHEFPKKDRCPERGEIKQRLDETIEQYARGTQRLANQLAERIAVIAKRHETLGQLEALQDDSRMSIRELSKRRDVLLQIRQAEQELGFEPNNWVFECDLEKRLGLLKQLKALEDPDPAARPSTRALQLRVKALRNAEEAEQEAR